MGSNTEVVSGHGPRASFARFEVVLIATLLAVWVPGVLQLAEVWRTVEYASHGFLVPFVALWAATAHRVELAEIETKPIRGGLLLVGGVAILYLVALAFAILRCSACSPLLPFAPQPSHCEALQR